MKWLRRFLSGMWLLMDRWRRRCAGKETSGRRCGSGEWKSRFKEIWNLKRKEAGG